MHIWRPHSRELAAFTRSLSTSVSAHEYTSPAASLAFRARVSRELSEWNKYRRPAVPFYKLRAHRVPTLWTLYRGLLRFAPDDLVRALSHHHTVLKLTEWCRYDGAYARCLSGRDTSPALELHERSYRRHNAYAAPLFVT